MVTDLILFNVNDLALLLVICECLMLSAILLAVSQGKVVSNRLLALFLIAFGLEALDTIIYWCAPLKAHFFSESSHLFFIFKFTTLIQGPLLYFYTKSLIYSDFTLSRKDLLHGIPLALFPFWLWAIFTNIGPEALKLGNTNYDIYFSDPFYRGMLWAKNMLLVSYGGMSYWLLSLYKERLKNNFSNIEKIDRSWLQILIGGFLALWAWTLLAQIFHQLDIDKIPDWIGLSGNYFDFIFINTLVFYSLLHSNIVQGVQSKSQSRKPEPQPEQIHEPHILALENAMTEDKLYLDPEITLDQLAEKTGLTTRQASNVINRHFKQNFFEFINYYRVEKAKELLTNGNEHSMLDIMEDAGFNSKSAFNRFFKKYAEMTPTQYRKTYTRPETKEPQAT